MSEAELVKRLERLEQDSRRLRKLGVVALVVAAAFGTMAATRPVPRRIVAHEFDVVNGAGKVRIRLRTESGFAAVQVLDAAGAVQAEMTDVAALGPSLVLGMHKEAAPSSGLPLGILASDVTIGDSPQFGPMITLNLPGGSLGPSVGIGVARTGQPNVTLLDSEGHDRADIFLSPAGEPSVTLSDSAGYSMNLGSTSLITPTTGETHQTSADSIVMFGNGKNHKVIWQAPQ